MADTYHYVYAAGRERIWDVELALERSRVCGYVAEQRKCKKITVGPFVMGFDTQRYQSIGTVLGIAALC